METNNSILLSIKKLLGINTDYEHFDTDLIIHINSVFMILRQMGVGPNKPFSITGPGETWDDFSENIEDMESIKTYVYLKCKLVFDAPTNTTMYQSLRDAIAEFEFRLNVEMDKTMEDED